MRRRPFVALLGVMMTVLATSVAGLVTPAGAANPYQRGPDPTLASLNASRGPFAYATVTVPRRSDFGGGTIYYPTDTSQGTFGGIAVSPGYTGHESSIAWTGPRLASHGFVVITIETLSIYNLPPSRASQLQAALNYLVNTSSVRARVDRSRLAVMGHSMGGGGTLIAARSNANLQAAVALQPYANGQNFSTVHVPSLIVGAQDDNVAPVGTYAQPFYEQIPAASEKAYLEVAGANHFLGTTADTTQARMAVVWMKRYVDNDTRYEPFMCPAPQGSTISEYRDTCPG